MTSFDHLTRTGSVHHLVHHLGNLVTTLVAGERYVSLRMTRNMAGVKYPDLLIAFNVDPAAYYRRNAYVISEQGKPPDFVLEIASRSTGREDTGEKRDVYATMGIPEYWRFDETGEFHGVRLAGDRLVDGVYEPIPTEQLSEDTSSGPQRDPGSEHTLARRSAGVVRPCDRSAHPNVRRRARPCR